MFDLTFDLKDAVLAYLKSQTEYNKAAVARMEFETKLQEERMAVMKTIKEQMQAPGGLVDLGDLLDADDDEADL